MSIDQEALSKLLSIIDHIEEDAEVDFLGTGSDSRGASKREDEWRKLFVEARDIISKMTRVTEAAS